MSGSPAPSDASVQISGEGDLAAAARQVLGRLAPLIAVDQTEAVVCTEVVIVPGLAPVFVMMQNRRPVSLTHEGHIDAWYGRHAELGVTSGVARYRQYHVRPDETAAITSALGLADPRYDGIACSYFETEAEAVELMSSDWIATEAIKDEVNFIDHARSTFGLYQDLTPERSLRGH
jgi:hypothetical protein